MSLSYKILYEILNVFCSAQPDVDGPLKIQGGFRASADEEKQPRCCVGDRMGLFVTFSPPAAAMPGSCGPRAKRLCGSRWTFPFKFVGDANQLFLNCPEP